MTTRQHTNFDATAAENILRKACYVAGVEPDGIEMHRFGDHAVFRICGGRIISRVGRSPDRLPSVRREVAVALWLREEKYPAARLVTKAEQPVVVDGHPVTFWQGLADGHTYANTREMGELLRRLHTLESPSFPLPDLQPFDMVHQHLKHAVIPADTRSYLASTADKLASEYNRLAFSLPSGPLHGDFNAGNILRDDAGHPKLIDLDGFVNGPHEWDLMQAAMSYDSFGWHTEAEYTDFVEGYGFDVREWPGYGVLRSVNELLMITWLSQNAGTNPRAADEVAKRVETLRTGGSRRDWAPF
ncbi:phosphotransferase enzyme family protein [Streptomyces lydicus]|uniref:phosphotransferase enzyme family protein n=1 Tax=Streptomyces lydicus TaxID=47763 RepID=UPI00379AE203